MKDIIEKNDMKIKIMIVGSVLTNCYIVSNIKTNEAFIVDPGDDADRMIAYINENQLKLMAIFLTHGHFDHIMAVNDIKTKYQIPVYAHKQEQDVLQNPAKNCSIICGNSVTVEELILVEDMQNIKIAGFDAQVLLTPGHTHGSICYYFEKNALLFSGDTLFKESVGRTDLPTGDTGTIVKSIKEKLSILPGDTVVFTGHGESTTIAYENVNNPYLGGLD